MKQSVKNRVLSLLAMGASFSVMAHDLAPLTEVEAGGKKIFANASGLTVYTFDADSPNNSNCYDDCAVKWPPVTVANADNLKPPLGTTTRKDGVLQLTLEQKPLYLYFRDKVSGDTKGDGLGGVWHIVPVGR